MNTTSNATNCGACGNVCATSYATGSGCRLGMCGCGPTDTLCGAAGSGNCCRQGCNPDGTCQ